MALKFLYVILIVDYGGPGRAIFKNKKIIYFSNFINFQNNFSNRPLCGCA